VAASSPLFHEQFETTKLRSRRFSRVPAFRRGTACSVRVRQAAPPHPCITCSLPGAARSRDVAGERRASGSSSHRKSTTGRCGSIVRPALRVCPSHRVAGRSSSAALTVFCSAASKFGRSARSAERHRPGCAMCFASERGAVHRKRFFKTLSRAAASIGLGDVHPRLLRHACGLELANDRGRYPHPRGMSPPPADRQHDPVYEDGCATL
jgi:hypothetical protein